MKVICARKDLFEGVQTAGRAVSSRSSLPILGHLHVKAEGNHLRIAATDLEVGMECTVSANVIEEGAFTLPAKIAQEMLSALADTEVTLTLEEGNRVQIKAGSSDYVINGLPPEEFPMLPEVKEEIGFTISKAALRDAIKKTIFAVHIDESRPFLTGVLLVLAEDGLRLVATDTHRLGVFDAEVVASQGETSVIVPSRAMNELSRILSDDDGEVTANISQNQILFKLEYVTLVSRLIEGQFPNFQRVIPADFDKKLIVPTDDFLSSVRRASIMVRENSNRTVIKTDDGKLVVTAESGAVGQGYEEVEVVREGEDIQMAFNAKYLLDFLNVVDCEAVEMQLTGPLNPAIIKPEGKEGYIYVVMPMQLG